MIEILIVVIFIFGFFVPILIGVFGFFAIIGDLLGAPYVPTNIQMVREILKEADLKKDQLFIELGSGDGRVVRAAVNDYQVKGLGIEIHLLLVLYAKFVARVQNLNNIDFRVQNFFNTDLKDSDVLFLFLLPKTLKKLKAKIDDECKKGTLVITHGFKIEGWEKKLIKKIDRKLFPTYYYKL